ncbi:MAG: hypothetical protein AB1492_09580 [Bacillota bacterium]
MMAVRLVVAALRAYRVHVLFLSIVLATFVTFTAVLGCLITNQAELTLDVIRAFRAGDMRLQGWEITAEDFRTLAQLEGIARVEPFVVLQGVLMGEDTHVAGITIPSEFYRLERNLTQGELPGQDELMLLDTLAARLGLGVGDRLSVVVVVQQRDGTRHSATLSLKVSGLLRETARVPNLPVVPLEDLQQQTGLYANVALVELAEGVEPAVMRTTLRGLFPSLHVQLWEEAYREAQRQRSMARAALERHTLLVTASLVFLIWVAVGLQARERRHDWAALVILGAPAQLVWVVRVAEAVIVCGLGAALGAASTASALRLLGWSDISATAMASNLRRAIVTSGVAMLSLTVVQTGILFLRPVSTRARQEL